MLSRSFVPSSHFDHALLLRVIDALQFLPAPADRASQGRPLSAHSDPLPCSPFWNVESNVVLPEQALADSVALSTGHPGL